MHIPQTRKLIIHAKEFTSSKSISTLKLKLSELIKINKFDSLRKNNVRK